MLRTIILIVLGVAMWVPTFLREENNALVIVTLVLTIINTLLTTHYFYRGGISSLPSPFVAATIWFASSAFPTLHSCWQAQLVIMGVLLACLVLLKMDYQHEATEEAFLATLICCVVAVTPSILHRYYDAMGLLDCQTTNDMACVVCFAHCYCHTYRINGSVALYGMVGDDMDGEHTSSIRTAMVALRCSISPWLPIRVPSSATLLHRQWRILSNNNYYFYHCQPSMEWLHIIQLPY